MVHRGKEEFLHNGQPVSGRPSPGPLTRKYEDFLRGLTVDNALQNDEFDFFVNGIKKFPVRVHPLTPEVEH